MRLNTLAALAAVTLAPTLLHAAPITETLDFSASGYPADAPFPTVTGAVNLTFDPAATLSAGPVNSVSLSIPTAATSFSFENIPSQHFVEITPNCPGDACNIPGNYFTQLEFLTDANGVPTQFIELLYAGNGSPEPFVSSAGSITVASTPVAPVPEPASLALLAASLATLAARPPRRPK